MLAALCRRSARQFLRLNIQVPSTRTLATGTGTGTGIFTSTWGRATRQQTQSPVSVLSRVSALRYRFSSTSVLANASAEPSSKSSDTSTKAGDAPILPPPSVGRWLLLSSTLVFAVIVVGGVTRLTESGLSITEWRPITGVLPPLTHDEWLEEFEKYKATPEFKLLNHSISLSDFKSIFFWEWGHRVLGRVIGLTFVFPLAYFAYKRAIPKRLTWSLTGLALLIGAQGALGWYMVKSGLEDEIMTTPGAVPRVSQYRLAAHLGTAFLLYVGMFWHGMAIIKDWKYAQGKTWSGLTANAKGMCENVSKVLGDPKVRGFKRLAWGLTGLVFLTALSGAFVAGLDAGLLYNEFPLMGGRLAPPMDELFSTSYAKNLDKSDTWWRNILENPTTVQFDHRVLAITTYTTTLLLWLRSRSPQMRAVLPPLTRLATTAAFAMANVQVLLGISTLLYLVPVPLAASHQAGSVALLTAMVHLLITLRRPGAAAKYWRQLKLRSAQGAKLGGSAGQQ
ncbi:electron transfer protein 1 [Macrolepiota fuliginosa MF-IS2]|uniref:Electron transfer protein 1 n=1 Tax=Macrolepiota fuliginosa MF-IS2 TaxID=1400762 RepID=A0A9P5XLY1_9AGAR|nr:electron transfer protein 1 [Macrolepiota fuliginosa MF-IS2]